MTNEYNDRSDIAPYNLPVLVGSVTDHNGDVLIEAVHSVYVHDDNALEEGDYHQRESCTVPIHQS